MCFIECDVDFIEKDNINNAELFFSVDLIKENDFNVKCDFDDTE